MSVIHKLPALERRAAIVDAAINLFADKGFRGTTTRELASVVGVSEPVLYQHFATKSELYSAIIESKCAEIHRVTAEVESFRNTADDEAFFTFLAELILDFHDQNPSYLRLLLYSGLERHELADRFRQRESRVFVEAVIDHVRTRVEQGIFRSDLDPAVVALSFMGMVANYGLDRILTQHSDWPEDRASIVRSMVSIFLEGIRRRA
ncbi:MAG TPA: TetR/AcrR family transcriptional regulator [Bryobacteraceae bacterium]|nr:TetR/AcrR family transcriptional regulator [Bryobacteraceae bacterium]